jgi:hypothetical protein
LSKIELSEPFSAKAMASQVVKQHQWKVQGDMTPISKIPKLGNPW